MKGLFIVFEGIDGSGTSTQATMLRDALQRAGRRAALTSEPSEGPIGNLIRQGMKGRIVFASESTLFDAQMAYLFAADRHDHLHNPIDGVYKLINNEINVISTRYYFSSFAYHAKNDTELTFVKSLNSKFSEPDLVIYLRNSVDRSMKRMEFRAHKDAYENAEKLAIVASNYDNIFNSYTGKLLTVDAHLTPDTIHNLIYQKILELLP
jgi:dTMP kinase